MDLENFKPVFSAVGLRVHNLTFNVDCPSLLKPLSKVFILSGGHAALLRSCQSWSRVAVSWTPPAQGVRGKIIGSNTSILSSFVTRTFTSLSSSRQIKSSYVQPLIGSSRCTLGPSPFTTPLVEQIRTKVRYSRRKGKPKAVHSVINRFYRLNWGMWIRTRAGRSKRLWKKSIDRKYRLKQHVFCNKTQSKLLDKMVTRFWRRPRYWVDDPYQPYHQRENFDKYFPQRTRQFFP